MDELKHSMEKIYRKAQKLLEQKQALEESMAKLHSETESLRHIVKEKDKLITSLNEEVKTIRLAKHLVGNTSNGDELSGKINEMIKELDGVIGKLKTEKE